MTIITKETLDRIFNPQREEGPAFRVNYQNQGPAELDKWLYFLEGKENCWRVREATGPRHLLKTKIIFCNGLLRERVIMPVERAFFSALIQNYEVYLWPGSDIRCSEIKPLNDLNEFWHQRATFCTAKKVDVERSFAQQGISPEDYIIIDYAVYQDILYKLSGLNICEYNSPDSKFLYEAQSNKLDLTSIHIVDESDLKHLIDTVELSTIVILRILTLTQRLLTLIQKNFPKLFSIEFENIPEDPLLLNTLEKLQFKKNSDKKWSHSYQESAISINHKNINNETLLNLLKNNASPPEKLDIIDSTVISPLSLKQLPLKRIYIKSSRGLALIDFSNLVLLESLSLEFCRDFSELNLKTCSKLKRLDISASSIVSISFDETLELEELSIRDSDIKQLNLRNFPKLKSVSINNCHYLESIDFASALALENLSIYYCQNLSKINLENYPSLKHLKINNTAQLNILDLSQANKLEEVELSWLTLNTLNVSGCPKLKKMKLDCSLNNLNFSDTSSLEEIELQNDHPSESLQLLSHQYIKRVHINGPSSSFLNFAMFPALEEMIISGNHDIKILSLTSCQRLRSIEIHSCSQLESVHLNQLPLLAVLNISSCSQLHDINIQDCLRLKKGKLSGCDKLASFNKNAVFEEFEFSRCYSLTEVNIEYSQLKSLTLASCNELSTLKLPSSLEQININYRGNGNIAELDLRHCFKLKKIDIDAGALSKLFFPESGAVEQLTLRNYSQLLPARSFHKLKHLELLYSSYLSNTLLEMPEIESIRLSSSGVSALPITGFLKLKHIQLSSSDIISLNLFKLPALETLSIDFTNLYDAKLEKLAITDCLKLKNFSLSNCKNLKSVDISLLPSLNSLFLGRGSYLDKLEQLSVHQCDHLKKIDLSLENLESVALSDLSQLEELTLAHCRELHTLKLSSIQLKSFKILSCKYLALLDTRQLSTLEVLEISDSNSLQEIDFQHLKKLRRLKIESFNQLKCLDLSLLPNLEELEISNCREFFSLDLQKVTRLQSLKIGNCQKLGKLEFPNDNILEEIEFSYTPNIQRINLNNSANLKKANFYYSARIIDLRYAVRLKDLKVVVNRKSNELHLKLTQCFNLKKLSISSSTNHIYISHLEQCTKLEMVELEALNAQNFMASFPPNCQVDIKTPSDNEDWEPESEVKLELQRSVQPIAVTNSNANPSQFCESDIENLTPQQKRALHNKNEASPVALCSVKKLIDPQYVDDQITTPNSPVEVKGDLLFVLNAKNPIDRHKYRIIISDHVRYDNDKISFDSLSKIENLVEIRQPIKPFSQNQIQEYQPLLSQHPDYVIGYFKGNLIPNILFPLPTHQALLDKTIEVYCNQPEAVTLFWNAAHQQYYVQSTMSHQAEILYCFKQSYNHKESKSPVFELPNKLLPNKVISEIDALKHIVPPKHPLHFIFDDHLSSLEKLNLLIKYCKLDHDNADENLQEFLNPYNNDIAVLIKMIRVGGSCRHFSRGFMVLARYLGVAVRLIGNEQHQFCEIPYINNNHHSLQWYPIDFGGIPTLDLTNINKRENVFEQMQVNSNAPMDIDASPAEKTCIEDPKQLEERQWEQCYYRAFTKLVEKKNLKYIDKLLQKQSPLSPLLELPANLNPLDVNKQIIQKLQENGFNTRDHYTYIHHPDDFVSYLHPYYLKHGKRKQKRKGPLTKAHLIDVNWSTFTSTDLAGYQSILDPEPTLLGRSFAKPIKVIGLISSNTENCSAFASRCKPYIVGATCFPASDNTRESPTNSNVQNSKIIDLYRSFNWRKHFLGDIRFKGHEVYLEKGPLIKAIKKARKAAYNLVVYNPPGTDADFELLIRRLKDEKKIIYNGKLLDIPDGFFIQTAQLLHPNNLPNVGVSVAVPINRKPFFLGLFNWHNCLEQLQFNEQREAENLPGYLHDYNNNKQFFYITEFISESDWQALLVYIQKEYPNKLFEFILAPRAGIENVLTNNNAAHPVNITADDKQLWPIVLSNDPDFYSMQLAAKLNFSDPLIIDVTPKTSFLDLIAKAKIEPQQMNPSKFDFIFEEQEILTALKNGQTVILNGELSPALYQQLLPLLLREPPYDYPCNGKSLEIKGRLFSVMPNIASQNLPLIYSGIHNYTFQDYKIALPKQDIKSLQQFYQLALKLPHRGMGRPTYISMSYQRLQNLLRKIKSGKLHPHNPIKGLFHYDYPQGSDDYAYLNVIAKCLFRSQDQTSANISKLKQLMEHYHIKNESDLNFHAWKILNCFYGETLIKLLDTNYEEIIDQNSAFPALTSQARHNLWQFLQTVLSTAINIENKTGSNPEKQKNQLRILLEDPDASLIVLKGSPGIGKTRTVRKLKKIMEFDFFEGEKGILKWLTTNPEKPLVLLLDEANMYAPNTWDFLKGLSRDKRIVCYQGHKYVLTPQHKIIATGNPENFIGRYYHSFFQNYGETILFKMPNEGYIEKMILRKILERDRIYQESITRGMLDAYHLILQWNPTFTFSNRNLVNLAERFCLLMQRRTVSPEIIHENLWYAAIAEFAWTIQDPKKREKFTQALNDRFLVNQNLKINNNASLLYITEGCSVPQEKALLVACIEQDLLLRERALHAIENKTEKVHYKRCTTLIGEAGIGKSKLLKAILEKHGYSLNSQNQKRKYYHLSVTKNKNIEETLLRAFNEGALVILDEINLNKALEPLLNQLLTGRDIDGNKPLQRGFMVFASQNPSYYKGRESVSQAEYDRMAVRYIDEYSDEALCQIANDKNIFRSNACIKGYKRCREDYPNANMRTFYTVLNQGFMSSPNTTHTNKKLTPEVVGEEFHNNCKI